MNSLYFDIKSMYEWYTQSLLKFKINLSTSPKEFEIRLRYITPELFKKFQHMFSLSSLRIQTTNDKVVTYTIGTSNYRQIMHSPTDVRFEHKEKVEPFDITFISSIGPVQTQKVRLGLAIETPITQQQFFNRITSTKQVERIRERTTYVYNGFHIDCTVVKQSNKNEPEYEIEIEYDGEKDISHGIQAFSSYIKDVFHIVYPHLHTLYTPDKYDLTLKLIQSYTIPQMSQPTNIQQKHLLSTHPDYIGEEIFNYAATNKLDGVNYKCFFLKGKGFILLQSGTDLWLEKINKIVMYDAVCSCEVTKDNRIHLFECLVHSSYPDIIEKPLADRIQICNQVVKDVDSSILSVKTFFTSSDVIKNIMHCMQYMAETYGLHKIHGESAVEYYNDGIILQYNGSLRPSNKRIVSSLKWKFPSKITIDFLARFYKQIGSDIIYQLYSKGNRPGQFVLFKTDQGPAELKVNEYGICDGISCGELDDKVLEIGVNIYTKEFKLFRIRTDKTKERTNSLFVANETYPQMVDLFTLPMLILLIEETRTKHMRNMSTTVDDYIMYEEGLFPYKRKHFSEEKTNRIINTLFEEVKKFNIFNEGRIVYTLEYKDKIKNKVIKGYIPGLIIKQPKLKDTIFKFPSEHGEYLSLITKEEDYNTIDILTDYFNEDIRMKGIVKSQEYSPEEYHRIHHKDCMKKLEGNGIPLTNFNMRECIFENSKETTLFRITLCKSILQLLSPGNNTKECKWLDISAGWGDRLITAVASDVKKYVAFDPNSALKRGHDEIIERFGSSDFERFHIIYEPFESGIKNLPENETFNLVFSSPPFFNFEIYSKEENQSISKYGEFQEWLHSFLFDSISSSIFRLESNGYLAIYIVDIGGIQIVEPLFQYIQSRHADMEYVGMIANLPLGKVPKPIWIWRKKGLCEVQLERFRRIHNQYKRDLIKEYVGSKSVLDLGSGRGGDITKYIYGGASFVTFVEPNADHVSECKRRLSKTHLALRSKVVLSSAEQYREKKQYDIVASFFTLSFFFKSEQTLLQFIDTVDLHCKVGGYFIGTTIVAEPLIQYLKERNSVIQEECYTIKTVNANLDTLNAFGQSIEINLMETKTATTQLEYLVYMDMFVRMLNARGFSLVFRRVYEKSSELSPSENRLSVCYGEFSFKKESIQTFDCIIDAVLYAILPKVTEEHKKRIIDKFDVIQYSQLGKLVVDDCKELIMSSDNLMSMFSSSARICLQNEYTTMDEFITTCGKTEKDKEILEGCVLVQYDMRKKELEECTGGIWLIEYICRVLRINCIIRNVTEVIINVDYPYVLLETMGNKYRVIQVDNKRLLSLEDISELI